MHIEQQQAEHPPTSTHYYSTSPPEAPPTSTHYYSTSPPEAPPTSTHYYESTSPSRSPAYFHSLLRIYIPSRSPAYFHSLLRIYIPSRSPAYFHSLLRIYIPSRSPVYFHSLLRIYIPSRSPVYFHSLLRIYIPSRSPAYFHSLLRIYIPSRSPSYFHSLLRIYIPSRSLRSASERRLVVPSQRGSKSLSRTFSFTTPGCWNDLPPPYPERWIHVNLQATPDNSSLPSLLDFIIQKKTSLSFLNFALFPLTSHCQICITSTSCVCFPLYNVLLIVVLNCKLLWIKASAKLINGNGNGKYLSKTRSEGGFGLPQFKLYYLAAHLNIFSFCKVCLPCCDFKDMPAWLQIKHSSCKHASLPSILYSPVKTTKAFYNYNPVIHYSLRIWKTVMKIIQAVFKTVYKCPIGWNHAFQPGLTDSSEPE